MIWGKEQKYKEKTKKEQIKECIKEEKRLNLQDRVVFASRDGVDYFIQDQKAREKFYYAPDFGVPIPNSLDLDYAKTLSYKIASNESKP